MKIVKTGIAGSLESSDVLVTVTPPDGEGIQIDVESAVIKQFGRQIRRVAKETLEEFEITDAFLSLQDKGALDSTIRARIEAAVYRGAGISRYRWRR